MENLNSGETPILDNQDDDAQLSRDALADIGISEKSRESQLMKMFNAGEYDLIVTSPTTLSKSPNKFKIVKDILEKSKKIGNIEDLLDRRDLIGFSLDEKQVLSILERLKKQKSDQAVFNNLKNFPVGYHEEVAKNLNLDFSKIDLSKKNDLWNLAYFLRANISEELKNQIKNQIKELQSEEVAKEHLADLNRSSDKKAALFFLRVSEALGYDKNKILGDRKEEIIMAFGKLHPNHDALFYGKHPDYGKSKFDIEKNKK